MKKVIIFLIVFFCFTFKVNAESFVWPSEGYLGWRFYSNTNNKEGIGGTYHTGVDIWSNSNGGWNNGVYGDSNPVYSAYTGQVYFVDSLGMIIKHNNTLYTKYWHIRNRQVSVNNNVNINTVIGYQDFAETVHIHVTVASSGVGHDADYVLDPSAYFGVQLDVRKSDVVPSGYHVTRSGCGGNNAMISNTVISGNFDCTSTDTINIQPETSIISGNGTVIFHIQ